jgi:hypothetical protein
MPLPAPVTSAIAFAVPFDSEYRGEFGSTMPSSAAKSNTVLLQADTVYRGASVAASAYRAKWKKVFPRKLHSNLEL